MSWTLLDTLLHCGPWEILPDDRPKVEAAARRYSKDPHLSKRDRDYVERTWLRAEEPEPEPLGFVFPEGDAA